MKKVTKNKMADLIVQIISVMIGVYLGPAEKLAIIRRKKTAPAVFYGSLY